ncbi:MAG: hypothetical protein JWP81_2291 [Ferruginibacter sp.]|nr:hypothetical protein [Ferruginibacter sp.]
MKFFLSFNGDWSLISKVISPNTSRVVTACSHHSLIQVPEENKRKIQSLLLIGLLVSLAIIDFSCKQSQSAIPEDVVYYYPEKNAYYDSQYSKYYYSLNGARTWDSMNFKGPGFGKVLGPKVPIKRTSDHIWLSNEQHRQQYKGVLLNVVNSRTISIAREDSIAKTRRPVIVKAPPKVEEKEDEVVESTKKGLKKFFSKLFGKKKKPAEEKKQ